LPSIKARQPVTNVPIEKTLKKLDVPKNIPEFRNMYPNVPKSIKSFVCPKCSKSHKYFSSFKKSCLISCLDRKSPYDDNQKIICTRGNCTDKTPKSLIQYLIHVDKVHGFYGHCIGICKECSAEFKHTDSFFQHLCKTDPSESSLIVRQKSSPKIKTRLISANQPHQNKNPNERAKHKIKAQKKMPDLGSKPVTALNKDLLNKVSKDFEDPKSNMKQTRENKSLMSELTDERKTKITFHEENPEPPQITNEITLIAINPSDISLSSEDENQSQELPSKVCEQTNPTSPVSDTRTDTILEDIVSSEIDNSVATNGASDISSSDNELFNELFSTNLSAVSSEDLDDEVNKSLDNNVKDMQIARSGDLVSEIIAGMPGNNKHLSDTGSKSVSISENNDKDGKITDNTVDISKIWQNSKKGKEIPKTTPSRSINKPKTWEEGLALQEEREKKRKRESLKEVRTTKPEKQKVKKKKRVLKCGNCDGCNKQSNCGKCRICLDGSQKKSGKCMHRRCHYNTTPNEGKENIPTRSPNKKKRKIESTPISSDTTETSKDETEKCKRAKKLLKRKRSIAQKPLGDSDSSTNDSHHEHVNRRKKKKTTKSQTVNEQYYSRTINSTENENRIPTLIIKKNKSSFITNMTNNKLFAPISIVIKPLSGAKLDKYMSQYQDTNHVSNFEDSGILTLEEAFETSDRYWLKETGPATSFLKPLEKVESSKPQQAKTFPCSLCGDVFSKSDERHAHYLNHTASILDKPREVTITYSCALCKEAFQTAAKRKDHYIDKHTEPNNNKHDSEASKHSLEEETRDCIEIEHARVIHPLEADKIVKERQEQRYPCSETECAEIFGNHAEMYDHWITTHFEKYTDKRNQMNDIKKDIKDKQTPTKYKLGKLTCSRCTLRFESLDEQRKHRKRMHGSLSVTPEPTEQNQTVEEETSILYICNQCSPPKLMNFEGVKEHQEREEPEHIAENLTVFRSVLKDKKILSHPSIAFLDVAYTKKVDGIATQTVIEDDCSAETRYEPLCCKVCTEKFFDQLGLINHIQDTHFK